MISILPLLFTLYLSLLITRIGAMAYMLTGLSREMARFQARSAFTGVGFTTTESEDVVKHPVRRRITMTLMLLGNLGIATVVATIVFPLTQNKGSLGNAYTLSTLVGGLFVLWFLATSRSIERHLNRLISFGLRKWGKLETRDYVAILHLQSGFAVSELHVTSRDWLAGRTLAELRLPDEGCLVLGIRRGDGDYLGTPTADTEIREDDTIVLYGPIKRIEDLDRRRRGRRGDVAHQEAIEEQTELLDEQERQELAKSQVTIPAMTDDESLR